jgi:hypothetical protein
MYAIAHTSACMNKSFAAAHLNRVGPTQRFDPMMQQRSPDLDYRVVTRCDDIKAIFADTKTFSVSITRSPIKPLAPQVETLRPAGPRWQLSATRAGLARNGLPINRR